MYWLAVVIAAALALSAEASSRSRSREGSGREEDSSRGIKRKTGIKRANDSGCRSGSSSRGSKKRENGSSGGEGIILGIYPENVSGSRRANSSGCRSGSSSRGSSRGSKKRENGSGVRRENRCTDGENSVHGTRRASSSGGRGSTAESRTPNVDRVYKLYRVNVSEGFLNNEHGHGIDCHPRRPPASVTGDWQTGVCYVTADRLTEVLKSLHKAIVGDKGTVQYRKSKMDFKEGLSEAKVKLFYFSAAARYLINGKSDVDTLLENTALIEHPAFDYPFVEERSGNGYAPLNEFFRQISYNIPVNDLFKSICPKGRPEDTESLIRVYFDKEESHVDLQYALYEEEDESRPEIIDAIDEVSPVCYSSGVGDPKEIFVGRREAWECISILRNGKLNISKEAKADPQASAARSIAKQLLDNVSKLKEDLPELIVHANHLLARCDSLWPRLEHLIVRSGYAATAIDQVEEFQQRFAEMRKTIEIVSQPEEWQMPVEDPLRAAILNVKDLRENPYQSEYSCDMDLFAAFDALEMKFEANANPDELLQRVAVLVSIVEKKVERCWDRYPIAFFAIAGIKRRLGRALGGVELLHYELNKPQPEDKEFILKWA